MINSNLDPILHPLATTASNDVVQGQWFPSNFAEHMPLPISD